MRIGHVLEVTTSFQHFKYGIEIRIKSVNQDDSHSWVRISYGTVKYVNDSIQDNTIIPADPQEEQVSQTSTSVVAARSKAKAKPQPRELVGTTVDTIRRYIEKKMEQFNSTKYNSISETIVLNYRIWSYDRWKACLAAGGGSKRRYQYCSDNSGAILYLRALQGHSGNNLIDPALQDNVVIGTGIFP